MTTAHGVEFHGYSDCVRLENEHTRVVLGPACGGRVLEYAWKGENAIWLDPAQAGWTWRGPGGPEIDPGAGGSTSGRSTSCRRAP